MFHIKITVITVVRNGEKTLEQTILSVINQTYKNIEYIIIDGGSTDGTVDIIKKYEQHLACWVSEPDKGIYDAMNKGIEKATGDFLFFLNSGDFLFENSTLTKIVKKMKCNVVYYGEVYMSGTRKLYWGKFSRIKLAIKNICHQSIFYPISVYSKYHYDLQYKMLADYHYNISIYSQIKFIYLNETIAFYDPYGISSIQEDIKFKQDVNSLILKNLGFLPLLIRILYKTNIKRLLHFATYFIFRTPILLQIRKRKNDRS
jgi:glycosyltransferase involved in cell wall biosynthesis